MLFVNLKFDNLGHLVNGLKVMVNGYTYIYTGNSLTDNLVNDVQNFG